MRGTVGTGPFGELAYEDGSEGVSKHDFHTPDPREQGLSVRSTNPPKRIKGSEHMLMELRSYEDDDKLAKELAGNRFFGTLYSLPSTLDDRINRKSREVNGLNLYTLEERREIYSREKRRPKMLRASDMATTERTYFDVRMLKDGVVLVVVLANPCALMLSHTASRHRHQFCLISRFFFGLTFD